MPLLVDDLPTAPGSVNDMRPPASVKRGCYVSNETEVSGGSFSIRRISKPDNGFLSTVRTMTYGRNVVVPMGRSDTSENALRHALREFPEADITVLHVTEPSDPSAFSVTESPRSTW